MNVLRLPRWVTGLVVLLALLAAPAVAQQPAFNDTATPKSIDDLKVLQSEIEATIAKVRDSTVGLRVGGAGGSGTLISKDGWIVTAAHVTGSPNRDCTVYLADGTKLKGKTMGLNRQADYALIKADTEGRDVPFVTMGDSDAVKTGQWVISMGHPLGTQVSPFRPPVVRIGRVHSIGSHIVADAPLISGDSGGPMFNLQGELIGINVSISGNNIEINNAVKINKVRDPENFRRLKKGEKFGGNSSRRPPSNSFAGKVRKVFDLLTSKKFDEAKETLANLEKEASADADWAALRYVQAALAAQLIDETDDAEKKKALEEEALGNLEKAVDKGFDNLQRMTSDPFLFDLADNARFKALIDKIQKLGGQPLLGIRGENAEGGVKIVEVTPDTAAAAAGVKVGDVIIEFDGAETPDMTALVALIGTKKAFDKVSLKLKRGAQELTIEFYLGRRTPPPTTRPGHRPGTHGSSGPRLPREQRKAGKAVREAFAAATATARQSTVRLFTGGQAQPSGYGVVISADGLILTKTELVKAPCYVELPDGRRLPAVKVNAEQGLDLVVLRVNATKLTPISFDAAAGHEIGCLLADVGKDDVPFAVGVQSLSAYNSRGGGRGGYMGVRIEAAKGPQLAPFGIKGGARITEVVPSSPADNAGLMTGDVIYAVGGKEVKDNEELVRAIQAHAPGDKIELELLRNGEKKKLTMTLGKRPKQPTRPGHRGNRLSGPLSKRASNFGPVIQHDSALRPQQMGGPIVNLDGAVIGMNIARSGRTKTWALGADVLNSAIPQLVRTAATTRPPTGQPTNDGAEEF